ncbi:SLC26A/SulP transporter domain [Phytophthora cactorum]|nr:SLC26A/SulP transporter domain [Phytophthora cactorum]
MSWLSALTGMQPRRVSDRYALPKPTWQQKVQHYAPIFRWLPNYSIQRDLKFDIVAGITVAMMLIPQEVSLSTIMHVPAHHGLYTAATAPLVYAIFGSSTVLSVASGSEVSLLVGSTLEDIEDEDERVATGIFMAFLSGCILLLVRILNLSQIADFFSRPVMGGFISAGGLLIMLSQDYPPAKVVQILENIGDTNMNAFAVAAVSILYLITVKIIKRRFFPSPVLMQLFESETPQVNEKGKPEEEERFIQQPANSGHGFSLTDQQFTAYQAQHTPQEERESLADAGKVEQPPKSKGVLLAIFLMREIPGGFPEPKVPWYGFTSHLIDGDRFGTIMYHALTVSVVVFLSSIAMSKRLAIQRGEDINTEQELTGIGIASVVCGFFQAMPPRANAHTQLASIITCLIHTVLPAERHTSLDYIVAGWTLVEFREAKWLYRVKRDEFFVWAASFALTLGLGVLNGLIASIICCVLALMWKSKVQPVAILGELDNGRFVDRENFPEANNLGDVIAVRVESSLYFANCERVAQFIEREMVRLSTLGITTRGVVLDTFHMNDMDATTIQVLSDTQEKLAVRGVRFGIANAKSRLYDLLAATNLLKRILANDPTISVDDAVRMMRELPPLADKNVDGENPV